MSANVWLYKTMHIPSQWHASFMCKMRILLIALLKGKDLALPESFLMVHGMRSQALINKSHLRIHRVWNYCKLAKMYTLIHEANHAQLNGRFLPTFQSVDPVHWSSSVCKLFSMSNFQTRIACQSYFIILTISTCDAHNIIYHPVWGLIRFAPIRLYP